MKKTLLLIALLWISGMTAQNFDLGKVSMAELQEKMHPTDTAAVAAILFNTGTVSYDYTNHDGFFMTTVVRARIKIYKKEGYDWANHKLTYYIGHNAKEEVHFTNAVTYNLVNGKIEKTKLKSDGEFNESINQYWSSKKITLPNVKEGSVIEYEYTIQSKNFSEMRPWNFQTSIPTNFSEFKTNIPEYYVYNAVQRGYVFPKVSKLRQQRTIVITERERPDISLTKNNTGGISSSDIKFMEAQTTYTAVAMPAMRDESYVNNIENYTSAITHELSMVQFPQQPTRAYANNWDAVTKSIYEDGDFGGELRKSGYFEDDIKRITSGLTDKNEITDAILNHVKSAVKWNEMNGYSCQNGVKTAYKNKTGNVAEINLMLTAMLRFAGVNANPVLVSTRANGIALFPNRTAFNYVVSAVETPAGMVLLDATEKYSTPNVLPLRDLNWSGRLIREDGSSAEVNMIPQKSSKEITNIMMTPAADGTVNGKVRIMKTDYDALLFRQRHLSTTKESYIENLQNNMGDIEIADYVRENDADLGKSVSETYSFTDSHSTEIIGDRMYISPLLFFTDEENPFTQETREYPVDFSYPHQRKYSINIDIPAGYAVETLPAPLSIAMEENRTAFRYSIAATGNKIQVNIIADVNHAIFPAEFYPALKGYFQQIISKQNEKIILKKV